MFYLPIVNSSLANAGAPFYPRKRAPTRILAVSHWLPEAEALLLIKYFHY